jgi:hypothetical protein
MLKFSRVDVPTAKWFTFGAVVVAGLVACGGSSSPAPVAVVSGNVTAGSTNVTVADKTSNAAVLAAVAVPATPVTFSTGFAGTDASGAAVAVTESTTVAFTANTADATAPKFAVSSTSGHAEGITTLGSCTFTITTSTYPASHPYAAGKTFKVNPCTVTVPTSGQKADGTVVNQSATFTFGTMTAAVSVPVSVSSTGTITLNNTAPGITVTVTNTTGGG